MTDTTASLQIGDKSVELPVKPGRSARRSSTSASSTARPGCSPSIPASPRRRARNRRSPISTATRASCSIAATRSTSWPNKWGDQWLGHVETIKPDYAKVLVRDNPDFDAAQREQQLGQLAQVSSGLHGIGVPLLYELLVPATAGQLDRAGHDPGAYRPRHPPRPGRAGDRRQPGARQRGFIHQSSASWRKTLLSIKLWLVLEECGKTGSSRKVLSHTLRSRRR